MTALRFKSLKLPILGCAGLLFLSSCGIIGAGQRATAPSREAAPDKTSSTDSGGASEPELSLAKSELRIEDDALLVGESTTVLIVLKDSEGESYFDEEQAANLSIAVLSTGTSSGTIGPITPLGGAPGVYEATFTATTGGTANTMKASLDGEVFTSTAPSFSANTLPTVAGSSVQGFHRASVATTLSASDADGNSLTYTIVSSPSNGSLSGQAPNLRYTPNSTFVGNDSFTFRVNDGTADSTGTATVTIAVPAAMYFNHDCDIYQDRDWNNATNWWRDDACGTPASRIPTTSDFVYIVGQDLGADPSNGYYSTSTPYPGPATPVTLAGFDTSAYSGDLTYFGGAIFAYGNITIQSYGVLVVGVDGATWFDRTANHTDQRQTWRGDHADATVTSIFQGNSVSLDDRSGDFTFKDWSINVASLVGPAVFKNSSSNYGTVRGDVAFSDDAMNTHIVHGNATFTGNAINSDGGLLKGLVSRVASFNGSVSAGGVVGACSGLGCGAPVTGRMYYCRGSAALWSDAANWFTDASCQTSAGRVPQAGDHVVALEFHSDSPTISLASYRGSGSANSGISIASGGSLELMQGTWTGTSSFSNATNSFVRSAANGKTFAGPVTFDFSSSTGSTFNGAATVVNTDVDNSTFNASAVLSGSRSTCDSANFYAAVELRSGMSAYNANYRGTAVLSVYNTSYSYYANHYAGSVANFYDDSQMWAGTTAAGSQVTMNNASTIVGVVAGTGTIVCNTSGTCTPR